METHERLETVSRKFFKTVGTPKLLGQPFFSELTDHTDSDVFEALLVRCGYENNSKGFFQSVLSMMDEDKLPVVIGGVKIPVLYLYALLETIFPGNGLYDVKTVEALESLVPVKPGHRPDLQTVMDLFPVRLSDHVIRQSRVSKGVAGQYLPFSGELDPFGSDITFDGHFKKGILEQMYQNRAIFLLNMACPVYCRFCFRKHKSTRKEKTPSKHDILAAADHVNAHPAIREILITGGEPLLNKSGIETALNALMKIRHVETIRIATRSLAYYPELFLKQEKALIHYLLHKNSQCLYHGKRIEMGVHFVHPDEVSVQSLEIISLFIQKGIQVYVQTPFLNGLNTDGQTLGHLFSLLRQAGVKIYYIFAPCSPIHGTRKYWAPIFKAMAAYQFLRANFSDRCMPKLCTATPLGKIEWQTSGFAVEKDAEDQAFTWIRTPYTPSYFKEFIPDMEKMPDLRVNREGTLDARFQVDMGNDALFTGSPPENKTARCFSGSGLSSGRINSIKTCLASGPGLKPSLCPTPSDTISRVHKTRIEITLKADGKAFDYIDQNPDITDAVLYWQAAHDPGMETAGRIVARLKSFSHMAAVRICCPEFTAGPDLITDRLIEKMSCWCDFSIGHPFRIEMETWFLMPDDIGDRHGERAKKLMGQGVNTYAQVPLIQGLNDLPQTIVNIADQLRRAAIEFHHLYVSGLDIQEKFNALPLDSQKIIDIASEVRKLCSGRQIPLYICWTPSGEKDFGLSEVPKNGDTSHNR